MKSSPPIHSWICMKITKNTKCAVVSWCFLVLTAGAGPVLPAMAQSPVSVVIDGELNDSLWRSMTPEKLAPIDSGVPLAFGGEIRSGVMGGYLYLGARLPDPTGRITARSVG